MDGHGLQSLAPLLDLADLSHRASLSDDALLFREVPISHEVFLFHEAAPEHTHECACFSKVRIQNLASLRAELN